MNASSSAAPGAAGAAFLSDAFWPPARAPTASARHRVADTTIATRSGFDHVMTATFIPFCFLDGSRGTGRQGIEATPAAATRLCTRDRAPPTQPVRSRVDDDKPAGLA